MGINPNHKPDQGAVIMLNGSSTVAGTEDGSQYHCPITGLEMNGRYKFCFFLTCGCVMSGTTGFIIHINTTFISHYYGCASWKFRLNGSKIAFFGLKRLFLWRFIGSFKISFSSLHNPTHN